MCNIIIDYIILTNIMVFNHVLKYLRFFFNELHAPLYFYFDIQRFICEKLFSHGPDGIPPPPPLVLIKENLPSTSPSPVKSVRLDTSSVPDILFFIWNM